MKLLLGNRIVKINQFITILDNKVIWLFRNNNMKKVKGWINRGFIVYLKKINLLYNKLRKRPFDRKLKLKFNRFRNLLNMLIKKAKILNYQKTN